MLGSPKMSAPFPAWSVEGKEWGEGRGDDQLSKTSFFLMLLCKSSKGFIREMTQLNSLSPELVF